MPSASQGAARIMILNPQQRCWWEEPVSEEVLILCKNNFLSRK